MKKTLALLLALAMALSLCACGGGTEELTVDNIYDYLDIDASVADCEVTEDSHSIGGFGFNSYEGEATVEVSVVNQSDAKFEDVTITCEVCTDVSCISKSARYGWEFNSGNQQTGQEPHTDRNYKTIEISLPYDGNWEDTEDLSLVLYDDGINFIHAPYDFMACYVHVVDVTGKVKK